MPATRLAQPIGRPGPSHRAWRRRPLGADFDGLVAAVADLQDVVAWKHPCNGGRLPGGP